MRYLDSVGFDDAPKIIGAGFSEDGREQLEFIKGEVINLRPWSLDGVHGLSRMINELHEASSTFLPEPDAILQAYFGPTLGGSDRIVSHCDLAPWNVVWRDRLSVCLIGWEYAVSIDPIIELAQAAWQNIRLFSGDAAKLENLPLIEIQAAQLHEFLNAYQLLKSDPASFLDLLVEYVVRDVAFQADEVCVTKDTVGSDAVLGMAWRARSAVG